MECATTNCSEDVCFNERFPHKLTVCILCFALFFGVVHVHEAAHSCRYLPQTDSDHSKCIQCCEEPVVCVGFDSKRLPHFTDEFSLVTSGAIQWVELWVEHGINKKKNKTKLANPLAWVASEGNIPTSYPVKGLLMLFLIS